MSQWRLLGRNPYGDPVEENATGRRRVPGPYGWEEEPADLSRVCRAHDADAGRLAMASMAVPEVSASFGHRLALAFHIWRNPVGVPTATDEATVAAVEHSGAASWRAFASGVARARGDAAVRAWAAYRTDVPGVPRWDQVWTAPSATACRGLQWGLARALEREATASPEARWFEWGLCDAADAATRRLPVPRRRLWAPESSDPTAAAFEASSTVPSPPRGAPLPTSGKGGAFRPPGMLSSSAAPPLPPEATPVIWCTRASRARWGEQGWLPWWTYLASGVRGWVVFDGPETELERAFAAAVPPATTTCWHIGTPAGELGRVWRTGARAGEPVGVVRTAVGRWAGPALRPPPMPTAAPDADGRVPYRSLSEVAPAQACAPARLEMGMHGALLDLAHEIGNLDSWVAEGLGIPVEALGDLLSPEQVDAVALGRHALESGAGFIVADATGFGKGRILAALATIGRLQGRCVLFLTENAPLFSDFFRDLLAIVGPDRLPVPELLHQDARVRLPDGTPWAQSLKPKAFKEWLASAEPAPAGTLTMTTYAQVGREHGAERVEWLRARLGERAWILLDEAHNAAGDSQASERVETLFAQRATVFASATFASHERNLDFYRPALPVTTQTLTLLRRTLGQEGPLLRQVLTESIARSGRLVRREPKPVPPPPPVWVPLTPELATALRAFEGMWRALFQVAEDWEKSTGGRARFAWARLGSVLGRSVREFSLLAKVDALADFITARLAVDEKVVVAVDSTFEAALREFALGRSPDEEEAADGAATPRKSARWNGTAPPLWRTRWVSLLHRIAPEGFWTNQHRAPAQWEANWRAALAAIDALPAWDVSPLDAIARILKSRGVPSAELSGRTLGLSQDATGWHIGARRPPDRQDIVASFNRGEVNVLFLTRAGSTGISLHAGRAFTDQRKRCMVEWDIATNPIHRVQFWGRVRRKDQVREPEFAGLLLDTPEERRVVEREQRKHARLAAHLGASSSPTLAWVSPAGERIVAEWALDEPVYAERLGLDAPLPDAPCGRVDRALVRSLVLPAPVRQDLVARLSRGLEVAADWAQRSEREPLDAPTRTMRRHWWWGDDTAALASDAEALGVLRVDAVERVWSPESASPVNPWEHAWPGASGAEVLEQWAAAWAAQTRAGRAATPYRREVWTWASQVLPGLVPGNGILLTDPACGSERRGVVLGVEAPAGPWSASQVALCVWLAGDPAPWKLPLAALEADPAFRTSGKPASPAWFSELLPARRALALEGNPVFAAAWGHRWGVGRAVRILDAEHGEQTVWLLPQSWNWERLAALPRDLIDVEHTVQFIKETPQVPLTSSGNHAARFCLVPAPGRLDLHLNAAARAAASASGLDLLLDKRLGRDRSDGQGGGVRPVGMKDLRGVLHSLENAGVSWSVPSEHAGWYRSSSRARCKTGTKPRGGG